MNNVAIIVSSCDFFKDCWEPFILSIQKYWADCPYPIYILSNNDEIETPKGFSFIKVGEDKMFASNLHAALNQIEEEYVIYLQEDYWLNKKVDNKAIAEHLTYTVENNIDYLRLTFPYLDGEDVGDRYKKHSLHQRYAICLQAAIWRRTTLIGLLREGDSGWVTAVGTLNTRYSNMLLHHISALMHLVSRRSLQILVLIMSVELLYARVFGL